MDRIMGGVSVEPGGENGLMEAHIHNCDLWNLPMCPSVTEPGQGLSAQRMDSGPLGTLGASRSTQRIDKACPDYLLLKLV